MSWAYPEAQGNLDSDSLDRDTDFYLKFPGQTYFYLWPTLQFIYDSGCCDSGTEQSKHNLFA